jgi:hypothetical protein
MNEQTRESKCSECDPGYGNINTMVKIENNVLYTCLCCVWMSVLGHVMVIPSIFIIIYIIIIIIILFCVHIVFM